MSLRIVTPGTLVRVRETLNAPTCQRVIESQEVPESGGLWSLVFASTVVPLGTVLVAVALAWVTARCSGCRKSPT